MVERLKDPDLVFRALGDPTRRKMIEHLSRADLTISELAQPFDMTLAGASKHVGVLEQAGLVLREKRGRERVCTLQPRGLNAARDWVERYTRYWDARLDALEDAIKEDNDD